MTSDGKPRAPYRDGPGSHAPTLTVRYVPFVWSAPIPTLVVALAAAWATQGEPRAQRLEHLAVASVFALVFAFVHFPIVTITARVEGGDLIISGSRWPGPTRTWSLTPREAAGFEVDVAEDGKRGPFRSIALRTNDGGLLPLTASTYRGGAWQHAKPVARLNAWLHVAQRV